MQRKRKRDESHLSISKQKTKTNAVNLTIPKHNEILYNLNTLNREKKNSRINIMCNFDILISSGQKARKAWRDV